MHWLYRFSREFPRFFLHTIKVFETLLETLKSTSHLRLRIINIYTVWGIVCPHETILDN